LKKGFTLAEVLITLGIIGVIAALTLPTLINNTQKMIYYSSFMKARNVLENAVQMYENDFGEIFSSSRTSSDTRIEAERFASYFNGGKFIDESNWQEECAGYNSRNVALNYDGTEREDWSNATSMCNDAFPYGVKTVDGMLFMLNEDKGYGNAGVVDTNGPDRGPNTMGRDIFAFYLNKSDQEWLCNSMWGMTKACAQSKGFTAECYDNNKRGDNCGQRLIDDGKMKY